MREAARLRPADQQVRFPYENAAGDPLVGWLAGDDILRENLARADNVLLVIDEARDHPATGWRQGDHLHKVWTARWEHVKLEFLEKVFVLLERRKRAAEFGPERFTEALLQLFEVTDELRITDQVITSLENEGVQPTVMRFLRWLYDMSPGAQDAFEHPTAEKAWVEATRVVLDALEVYDLVLDARSDVEPDLVAGGLPAEDSGLRIPHHAVPADRQPQPGPDRLSALARSADGGAHGGARRARGDQAGARPRLAP